ncbi:CopG family transcriptional regulator [Yoonia maritima]|uniref:ribbon-helix-helix domain-containing protein n=1 Tax=Yoonia maritima TaxID=1435347 RepID=UPI0013A5F812|nr:CopG family transcriptional regulator [Yoonia maritima]
MAVQRKPKKATSDIDIDAAEQFISGASTSTSSAQKSKKTPVALRFDNDLLARIDAMASRRGMSRNAIISYWCSKGVESE